MVVANVKYTSGLFGCIFDGEHCLLLVRRSDGRWNLPGGGVDEDDAAASRTDEEVVAREVEEETGFIVRFHDPRPLGTYPTAKHTDRATTWWCDVVGGQLRKTEEGIEADYFSPAAIMELAEIGDTSGGLVGGLRAPSDRPARHIQMCLQAFTRSYTPGAGVSRAGDAAWKASLFCKELGIPE